MFIYTHPHTHIYMGACFLWKFAFSVSNTPDPLYGTVQDPKKLTKLTACFVYLFSYFLIFRVIFPMFQRLFIELPVIYQCSYIRLCTLGDLKVLSPLTVSHVSYRYCAVVDPPRRT